MNNFFLDLGNGMIPWYAIVICAVLVYFLGNINPAILLGRAKGVDIRSQGSGNAGATNALRSLGKKAGAITFIIDVIKGWVGYAVPYYFFLHMGIQNKAVLDAVLSSQSSDENLAIVSAWSSAIIAAAMLCGLCVALGHMYPVVFGFRGGKGVSTVFGVLLAESWPYALILLAVVVVFTLIFRRVSLSVLIAVAVALVLVFWNGLGVTGAEPLWIVILLALVVFKHRSNISRLVHGKEPKLSFGKSKEEATDKEAANKEAKGEEN